MDDEKPDDREAARRGGVLLLLEFLFALATGGIYTDLRWFELPFTTQQLHEALDEGS
jgi:hypothetical protein